MPSECAPRRVKLAYLVFLRRAYVHGPYLYRRHKLQGTTIRRVMGPGKGRTYEALNRFPPAHPQSELTASIQRCTSGCLPIRRTSFGE